MTKRIRNLKLAQPGEGYWVNRDRYNSIGLYCNDSKEAQLVYCALSRIMADRKARRFNAGASLITYSGLPLNRIEKALGELERIGAIARECVTYPGGVATVPFITILGEVRYE
jgi:hypothetical protein